MTSGRILVEHADSITTITFNRPDDLNALDPAMVLEFMQILDDVDAEPSTSAVVVTGAGRAFTAGGDVKAFGSHDDPRVHRRGWHLVYRMLEFEKPMVAMVNGAAVGLGLTIALLCDAIVLADDAKLGDSHVGLGLVAGDGVAVVLPLLVGPHRAKELLITGRLVTGREAYEMGIGNAAVPREDLHRAAYDLAAAFAAQPTYAARATKMVLNRYVRAMAESVLDTSLAYEAISRTLPEYPEAVEAWKRRQAEWRTSGS